jgi:hypothetical protein
MRGEEETMRDTKNRSEWTGTSLVLLAVVLMGAVACRPQPERAAMPWQHRAQCPMMRLEVPCGCELDESELRCQPLPGSRPAVAQPPIVTFHFRHDSLVPEPPGLGADATEEDLDTGLREQMTAVLAQLTALADHYAPESGLRHELHVWIAGHASVPQVTDVNLEISGARAALVWQGLRRSETVEGLVARGVSIRFTLVALGSPSGGDTPIATRPEAAARLEQEEHETRWVKVFIVPTPHGPGGSDSPWHSAELESWAGVPPQRKVSVAASGWLAREERTVADEEKVFGRKTFTGQPRCVTPEAKHLAPRDWAACPHGKAITVMYATYPAPAQFVSIRKFAKKPWLALPTVRHHAVADAAKALLRAASPESLQSVRYGLCHCRSADRWIYCPDASQVGTRAPLGCDRPIARLAMDAASGAVQNRDDLIAAATALAPLLHAAPGTPILLYPSPGGALRSLDSPIGLSARERQWVANVSMLLSHSEPSLAGHTQPYAGFPLPWLDTNAAPEVLVLWGDVGCLPAPAVTPAVGDPPEGGCRPLRLSHDAPVGHHVGGAFASTCDLSEILAGHAETYWFNAPPPGTAGVGVAAGNGPLPLDGFYACSPADLPEAARDAFLRQKTDSLLAEARRMYSDWPVFVSSWPQRLVHGETVAQGGGERCAAITLWAQPVEPIAQEPITVSNDAPFGGIQAEAWVAPLPAAGAPLLDTQVTLELCWIGASGAPFCGPAAVDDTSGPQGPAWHASARLVMDRAPVIGHGWLVWRQRVRSARPEGEAGGEVIRPLHRSCWNLSAGGPLQPAPAERCQRVPAPNLAPTGSDHIRGILTTFARSHSGALTGSAEGYTGGFLVTSLAAPLAGQAPLRALGAAFRVLAIPFPELWHGSTAEGQTLVQSGPATPARKPGVFDPAAVPVSHADQSGAVYYSLARGVRGGLGRVILERVQARRAALTAAGSSVQPDQGLLAAAERALVALADPDPGAFFAQTRARVEAALRQAGAAHAECAPISVLLARDLTHGAAALGEYAQLEWAHWAPQGTGGLVWLCELAR